MSFLVVSSEGLTEAVGDFAGIGSMINAVNAAVSAPTTDLIAAATDEVSEQIAALFCAHTRAYQSLSAEAAAFHDRFVRALTAGTGAYTSVEAANASPLELAQQQVLGVINAPTQALLGRPLIGDGTAGQTVNGVGQAGGAGGSAGVGGSGGTGGLLMGASGVSGTAGTGGTGNVGGKAIRIGGTGPAINGLTGANGTSGSGGIDGAPG